MAWGLGSGFDQGTRASLFIWRRAVTTHCWAFPGGSQNVLSRAGLSISSWATEACSSSVTLSRLKTLLKLQNSKEKSVLWGSEDVWLMYSTHTHPHIHPCCRVQPKLHAFNIRKQTAGFYNWNVSLSSHLRVNHWNLGTRWVWWYCSLSVRYSCSFSWQAFEVLTKTIETTYLPLKTWI